MRTYRGYLLDLQKRKAQMGGLMGLAATEAELIRLEVNRLLEWLYDPTPSYVGWQSGARADELGLSREAINWGDLSCDVEPRGDGYFDVYLEEVSPDASLLCKWVEARLRDWGWTQVRVSSEW